MTSALVVMPLHNARPYVRASIESILAQTYPDFILLVINDGSRDGSELEVAAFEDHRVILWQQDHQGPGAAMNRALQYALDHKIPFLARMDADDLSLPRRLEAQINLLDRYPAAACSVNCNYINLESEQLIGSSTVSISPGLIHWEISHGLRGLIQGACLFRTDALASIGGYRTQFKRAEEVDVFLRLAEQYQLRNCPEFLYNIRIRACSHSLQNIHENVLYQFFALDCATKRRKGTPEPDFVTFLSAMPLNTRISIWREEVVLKLWRSHIHKRRPWSLLLASLLDPRRVLIRWLRKLDKQ